ncbi:MAG TPA: AraC family transcriptional regulator [Chitinophagaceae bacterium]
MLYNKLIYPSKELAHVIQHIRILEASPKELESGHLIPVGASEMVFNLSETPVYIGETREKAPVIEWIGQFTRAMHVQVDGPVQLLIVRFHPHTARIFSLHPMNVFTNTITPLQDLMGAGVNSVFNKMQDYQSWEQRISLLYTFLKRSLYSSKEKIERSWLVQNFFDQQKAEGNKSTTKIRYSERYFQKLFKESVGISPRKYYKIQRFHKSITLLEGREENLARVAFTCGYSDQSHFNREFKEMAGCTPLQYQHNRSSVNTI